jgi:serine protease Do
VRAGDIIERVDQDPVSEGKDLLRAVLQRPVGSEVTLTIRRDGKQQALKVKTSERPGDLRAAANGGGGEAGNESSSGELGLQLQALTPGLAQQLEYAGSGKVLVANVRSGSPADSAGLQRGDVLVEADRKPINNANDVINAASDGKVLLRVERGNNTFFTVLTKE